MTSHSNSIQPGYLRDNLDTRQMNRMLRHRLRNMCTGLRLATESIQIDASDVLPNIEGKCVAMIQELDDLLGFTQRMDLLFDQAPPSFPLEMDILVGQAADAMAQRFPFCELRLEGPEGGALIEKGSWIAIILDELLANAGQAAGRNGEVRFIWSLTPDLEITVVNTGEPWPETIPINPPVPFHTTWGQHDGLGLAIVKRLCDAMDMRFDVLTHVPGAIVTSVRANKIAERVHSPALQSNQKQHRTQMGS